MSAGPSTRIRRATPDDAAMLAELATRIFVETFGALNTAEDMGAYVERSFNEEQVARELADEASIFFVADTPEGPAGYARLHAGEAPGEVRGRRPVELVRLYVDQCYHGTGVAPSLMQACIDVARAGGHDSMHLGVWEHNPRAQAFYRRWGFEKVGDEVFELGADVQTDWIMERPL